MKHGGREGKGEGDEPDLAEVEREALLDHGIERHDQRLDHVVEEMADADRGKNRDRSFLRRRRSRGPCLIPHGLSYFGITPGNNCAKPSSYRKGFFGRVTKSTGRNRRLATEVVLTARTLYSIQQIGFREQIQR